MSRIVQALCAYARLLQRTIGPLWRLLLALLAEWSLRRSGRPRKLRPWMLVRRTRTRAGRPELAPRPEDVRRLLERMRLLEDVDALSSRAVAFAGEGVDFFGEPAQVERIVEALARENPPFLHLARELPDSGEGRSGERRTEYLLRERDVVVREPITLFVPQLGVEHLESRRPPGYPLLRAARSLSDLRAAPLLYQTLPDDLLVARLLDGSVPVLAWKEERRTLLFRPELRVQERKEHRRVRVPVEVETGGETGAGRLVYLLFDRSTSLVHACRPRGVNAVMELAIAVAMLRADLGRAGARYFFRAFADRLDPLPKDAPVAAVDVAEKDALVRRLFATSFSGQATRVVDALETAADDVERWRRTGEVGAGVEPRIGLLTDGRSSIYGGIGARLKRLGIALDTVLIGREAAHNPELVRLSSTVSVVDPSRWHAAAAAG